MARGGARDGAGRKVGGANKLDAVARAKAMEGGITPLDYMLGLLRDESNPKDVRLDAAKSAAPYVHAKLSNVEASVEVQGDITVRASKEQRDAAVSAAIRSANS